MKTIQIMRLEIEALMAILPEMQAEMHRELQEKDTGRKDFDPMVWTSYLGTQLGMEITDQFLMLNDWTTKTDTDQEAGLEAAETAYNKIVSIFKRTFVSFDFMMNEIPNTGIKEWFNAEPLKGANPRLAELTLNLAPESSESISSSIRLAIDNARMLYIFNQWNTQPSLREKTKNILKVLIEHSKEKSIPVNINKLKTYYDLSQSDLRRNYNYAPIALRSDPLPPHYKDFSGEYVERLFYEYTPLMIAIIHQLTDLVELLLDIPGIDLTVAEPTYRGAFFVLYQKTAVDWAYDTRNTQIIQLVRKAQAIQFLNEAKTADQSQFNALKIKHNHAKITATLVSEAMVTQVQSLVDLQKTDDDKIKVVVEALAKTPTNTPLGDFLGNKEKESYQQKLFLMMKKYATPHVIEEGTHTGKMSQITPAREKEADTNKKEEADKNLNKLL
jgi:hypothetical protein